MKIHIIIEKVEKLRSKVHLRNIRVFNPTLHEWRQYMT